MNGKLLDWAVELQALAQAGLDAVVQRVIAVQDRERHNAPRYAYKVCKVFVLCTVTGGSSGKIPRRSKARTSRPMPCRSLPWRKTRRSRCRCASTRTATRIEKRFLSERGSAPLHSGGVFPLYCGAYLCYTDNT